MKHFIISQHTSHCACRMEAIESSINQNNWIWPTCCNDAFLVFVRSEFILIEYPVCLDRGDKHDFRQSIITQAVESAFVTKKFMVYRGVIGSELAQMRKTAEFNFDKKMIQVNYIYRSASKKEYGVCSLVPVLDQVVRSDETFKDSEKMRKYLIENDLTWHLEDLNSLLHYNAQSVSEYEVVKTINDLISSINKISKQ
jgi:hypothetical protein